jgi:photosystem II stability/assembly factor-like uncharacterized protein
MGMLPLAVAPDSPQHLFAATGNQIAESVDGGKTWQPPGPGGLVTALAMTPTGAGILYAGTEYGLFTRSAAGNWQQLSVTLQGAVMALALSATQPPHIALVDEHGSFYRSDDAGQTWISK